MNANAESAFTWLSMNVSPIPVQPRSKIPAVEWRQWQNHTPPPKVVDYWFRDPNQNIGVICGGPSNLAIIDFDDIEYYYTWRKDVIKTNDEWSEVAGKTYRVRTARGMHLYVYTKSKQKSRKDKEHSVDIRCSANYTLVPPSVHPTGRRYEAIGSPNDIIIVSDINSFIRDTDSDDFSSHGTEEVDIFKPVQINLTVEELKQRVPILRFVSQFSKPYRTSVDGRWWMSRCIHPHHADRNPSFQIDTVAGRAKCLSSRCALSQRKGLDVIALYAEIHGLTQGESIRELAQYF